MRKFIYLLVPFFLSCNLTGNQSNCNDSEAKEMALELLKKKLENEIREESYSTQPADSSIEASIETGKRVEKEVKNKVAKLGYNNLKLENIITTAKFDTLKKCHCESHIQHETIGRIDFFYSVQLTDDGKIYVEELKK
jgi:hypothetical protein